jgi:drug/metabolite transporter (DMT)-like permease
MAVLLALLSAVGYGAGDFCAGLASRRFEPGPVSAATQTVALVAAVVSLTIIPGHSPTMDELWWGAASGVGSGVGRAC